MDERKILSNYYTAIDRPKGFWRLAQVLFPQGPIPVSKSTWWAGVKSGRFPKPIKLGPRITVWRIEDIQAYVASQDKTV